MAFIHAWVLFYVGFSPTFGTNVEKIATQSEWTLEFHPRDDFKKMALFASAHTIDATKDK